MGLALRYAAGVTVAHLLSVTEVLLVMTALRRETLGDQVPPFTQTSSGLIIALAVLALLVVAVGNVLIVLPSLRWYVAGATPTPRQRRAALRVMQRSNALLIGVWLASGAAVVAANPRHAWSVTVLVGPAVFFGATAAVCTALLLTVRTLHPLSAAAGPYETDRDTAPGVLARLLTMWVLCCALPSVGIALLILIRSQGWVIDESSSVEIPVLVLAGVAVLWGLRGMVLVARSISDPVQEVAAAMADVQHGNIRARVDVYERSEIGLLQSGFNAMVAGLRERDRLRVLFGRQVGDDVVELLLDGDEAAYRDVRDVTILFVDLAGSTEFAASRPPEQVADMLNGFYESVIEVAVDHNGFINKFLGDAALVIFGAPLPCPDPTGDARAMACALADRLHRTLGAGFGIGVARGRAFAGFVGTMNRFEYTVIGDPVNEAARLADRAKLDPARLLCTAEVLADATEDTRQDWVLVAREVLRGRRSHTEMYAPRS